MAGPTARVKMPPSPKSEKVSFDQRLHDTLQSTTMRIGEWLTCWGRSLQPWVPSLACPWCLFAFLFRWNDMLCACHSSAFMTAPFQFSEIAFYQRTNRKHMWLGLSERLTPSTRMISRNKYSRECRILLVKKWSWNGFWSPWCQECRWQDMARRAGNISCLFFASELFRP